MMNRLDTALSYAADAAMSSPGRYHRGRSGQVEVIAVVITTDGPADFDWVALEIDLSVDEECRLLGELQANDATSPGPVD